MFEVDNSSKKAIVRTIRFTEDLLNELNQIADQNSMSLSMLVLQCCKYALDNKAEDS